jgi:hypothetical protein
VRFVEMLKRMAVGSMSTKDKICVSKIPFGQIAR